MRKDREKSGMSVQVRNNDINGAMRVLKKRMQTEGVFNELRERGAYQSKSEKRRLADAAGRRRWLKKVDKLKEIVKCPDCNMDMTVHTLKYIHKRRGFCKADVKPEVVPEQKPEPIVQPKKKIVTEAAVNEYIKENPDIVSNYLRNERAMKAQRKQMNARTLLNNAF